ncbi:hypothetical protein Y032_0046g1309 [Ancylostoma ceylanicum]|uniref:Uncharacterized protein n=1 Tax=Ancylostoma ceylanicum TaxID=53326 RepID=A0A016UBS0_9BILA|nr:hypothetical protein Y032_0046g1309 [Ancylostoma ceylanicum]
MSSDILIRLSTLETQLVHTNEKVKMREHVIEQLEEEIQAKEQLIYEQGHLIHILESENKFDEFSLSSPNAGRSLVFFLSLMSLKLSFPLKDLSQLSKAECTYLDLAATYLDLDGSLGLPRVNVLTPVLALSKIVLCHTLTLVSINDACSPCNGVNTAHFDPLSATSLEQIYLDLNLGIYSHISIISVSLTIWFTHITVYSKQKERNIGLFLRNSVGCAFSRHQSRMALSACLISQSQHCY